MQGSATIGMTFFYNTSLNFPTHTPNHPSIIISPLPPPSSHLLALRHLIDINPHHRLTQILTNLRQNLRILKVRNSLHNRLRPLRRIPRLKDTRPDKHTITTQLHHQRRIRRRRHTPRRKVNHGQPPQLSSLLKQLKRRRDLLSQDAQLGVRHARGVRDLRVDGAHVADCLDDVAGAGFAFGADHGCAFADAAEGFAEVAAAAHEGDGEGVLLDVVGVVGGGEDFGLVDVVDADGFEDLEGRGMLAG
jgi:hypothetical protein